MPVQITPQVTDNGEKLTIEIAGSQYEIDKSELLDRTFDPEQVLANLRLTFHIGNYGQFNSMEFIDQVNKGNVGMQLACGNLFINSIELQEPGVYTIGIGSKRGGTDFELQVNEELLTDPNIDKFVVILNMKSFLRLAKHSSISAQAIAALNRQAFWY